MPFFDEALLVDNIRALVDAVNRAKPAGAKLAPIKPAKPVPVGTAIAKELEQELAKVDPEVKQALAAVEKATSDAERISYVCGSLAHAVGAVCGLIVAAVALTLVASADTDPPEGPPSKAELAAITRRGRDLAGYDAAAWHASDAVMARKPKPGSVGGVHARLSRGLGGEVVRRVRGENLPPINLREDRGPAAFQPPAVLGVVARLAGLPLEVCSFNSNRQCGSSMETLHRIAMSIAVGATECGIALGIDYTLLMVTRFREWRAVGLEPAAATVATLDTAGRAVMVAGSTVVVGGRDQMIHAFEAATGKELWNWSAKSAIDASPVVVGNRVVAGAKNGAGLAPGLKTGQPVWRFSAGAPAGGRGCT